MPAPSIATTLDDLDELLREVIAPASHEVDRHARFPVESIAQLRARGLLSAAAPARFGGLGLGLADLSDVAQRLARACAATSMIWVMHQVQLACLALVADVDSTYAGHLRTLTAGQALVASVTSEIGVGGDLRSSVTAPVENADGSMVVEKASPTISYADHADAYLLTARRTLDSPPDDQVAILLYRDQVQLEPTGGWDVMGMRGTVSPSFRLKSSFAPQQILPVPFGELAARVMVPWSHILWVSCWYGLALEAYARARQMVRARGRGAGKVTDVRLAEAARNLSLLKASITEAIDYLVPTEGSLGLLETARLNDLKVSGSLIAVDVAETSLEICGMAGYQERAPLSIARILRDLYSARLMIANQRIFDRNAHLALARST
jgi:acyl-CoA dehydrogenase